MEKPNPWMFQDIEIRIERLEGRDVLMSVLRVQHDRGPQLVFFILFWFKGTVNDILSDIPCKDGNTQFTTVPLKAWSDQV